MTWEFPANQTAMQIRWGVQKMQFKTFGKKQWMAFEKLEIPPCLTFLSGLRGLAEKKTQKNTQFSQFFFSFINI